jgi:hypothetical protein
VPSEQTPPFSNPQPDLLHDQASQHQGSSPTTDRLDECRPGSCRHTAGEHTPPVPQAGDAVRLAGTWKWSGIEHGDIGVINGLLGQPDDAVEITFNASIYRDNRYVSCSGGPATIATPVGGLQPTGEVVDLQVWRFKNGIRQAHNQERHTVTVPLWDWHPSE